MSSSTPSNSENPSSREKQVDDLIGDIQQKLEILMVKESAPMEENDLVSRLEALLRKKDDQISHLKEEISQIAKNSETQNIQVMLQMIGQQELDNTILKQELAALKASSKPDLSKELEEARARIRELEASSVAQMTNEAETAQLIMDMEHELREAKKAMEQMITVQKEVKSSNEALERSLRKEINKIGASLGQCRAQKADVERKLKEAQEKIEVLKLRPLFHQNCQVRRPDHSPARNSNRRSTAGATSRDVTGRTRSPDHSPPRSRWAPYSEESRRYSPGYDEYDARARYSRDERRSDPPTTDPRRAAHFERVRANGARGSRFTASNSRIYDAYEQRSGFGNYGQRGSDYGQAPPAARTARESGFVPTASGFPAAARPQEGPAAPQNTLRVASLAGPTDVISGGFTGASRDSSDVTLFGDHAAVRPGFIAREREMTSDDDSYLEEW